MARVYFKAFYLQVEMGRLLENDANHHFIFSLNKLHFLLNFNKGKKLHKDLHLKDSKQFSQMCLIVVMMGRTNWFVTVYNGYVF